MVLEVLIQLKVNAMALRILLENLIDGLDLLGHYFRGCVLSRIYPVLLHALYH